MKTDNKRVHICLDASASRALDTIALILKTNGQRADRSTCVRHALVRCARSITDLPSGISK